MVRKVLTGTFGSKASSWKAVVHAINMVTDDMAALLPLILEPENVVKGKSVDGRYPYLPESN